MKGAGARGLQVQLRPPPDVAVSFGGGGTPPWLRGGQRAGAPAACRPGKERGGGGGRSAAPRPPAPLGGPWPPPLSSFVSGVPPWGILVHPVDRQWVSVAGGGAGRGGSDLLTLVRAPAFPRPAPEWAAPFAPSWALPFRCRSVAGNAGVCGRSIGGAWRATALAEAVVSPPWVQRATRGDAGPLSLRPASVRSWAGGGRRGGGPLVP